MRGQGTTRLCHKDENRRENSEVKVDLTKNEVLFLVMGEYQNPPSENEQAPLANSTISSFSVAFALVPLLDFVVGRD
ncbi:hypothetical protein RRG08_048333 [Elysia crispata]|uniref:Uncharacterized protein n=1 Tax=Elysia crispata TaxID=231223 RepID=A0AAE1AL26_9GAST|nr:hypothetical protein RRG08_048333 [Elysia crispata]